MYKASIVVTFNNEYALTENFFGNLLSIIREDMEVIAVVDGLTESKSASFLQSINKTYRHVRIIFEERNLGYSRANNLAASYSQAPYIIFLNSDTFPINESLYKLVEFMEKSADIGVAQGLILYPQNNHVQSAGHIFGFYKTTHAFDGLDKSAEIVQQIIERQALGSGFYITRRELFVAENGFDEIFYNAWEGLEYSLKIHFKGYKCMYFPQAEAYHVKGSGRNHIFRDETYQIGYFWHKWGDKIKIDIPQVFQMQMLPNDYNKQYLLVNGSSVRNNIWEIVLAPLRLKTIGYYTIEKSLTKKNISLEDSVPLSFLQSRTSLLFTMDNFQEIINNYRVMNYRIAMNTHDIILDFNGNVVHPSDFYR